jgi:tRNA 2-thiouridine synthesizing protein A
MAEHVLDLRGLKCPLPVLKAKKQMKSLALGDRLVLECTDPLTVIDVPHYANQDGHRLENQEQRADIYRFTIVKAR